MDQPNRNELASLWDAPWTGVGLGIIIGAFGGLVNAKWIIAAGWLIVSLEFCRHDYFHRGWKVRLLVSVFASLFLGSLLVYVWHVAPKPPEPLTMNDVSEAVKREMPSVSQNAPSAAAQPNTGNSQVTTKAELEAAVNVALVGFEDSQAGRLSVEGLKSPVLRNGSDWSFILVNRGNSAVRITLRQNYDNEVITQERAGPDFSEIRKQMKLPLKPSPEGETIFPGLPKTYNLGVPNGLEVDAHHRNYAIWFTWSYLDVFNRPQTLNECLWYEAFHHHELLPCPDTP